VRAQHHEHRRGLREFVQHLKPDAELHTFFPWLSSQHGYGAVAHKAFDGLFDRKRPLALQKRGAGEKAIANCSDCAHGAGMSERPVFSAHTQRHDYSRAT
jgi:hypothetical protein